MLIITADDFGKNLATTNNIIKCSAKKSISSVSAMVFMHDSERAASLSRMSGLEIGLHLNFTEPFTSENVPYDIRLHQRKISNYLNLHRLMQLIYNPILCNSFIKVYNAQLDEFKRLYNKLPSFFNGHHHMHLCSNMVLGRLIPEKSRIRGTFTFHTGEKNFINLCYRYFLTKFLTKHYITTTSFFSIAPIHNEKRINSIFQRAHRENVEVEVHPENHEEKKFLLSKQYQELLIDTSRGTFGNLNN